MSGIQYNIAVSIFFIPFVLAEVPSNIVLNKVPRPSWYMGTIVAIWGVVMTLTGIVHNYASLLAIRVLLGLFEYVRLQLWRQNHTSYYSSTTTTTLLLLRPLYYYNYSSSVHTNQQCLV